MILKILKGGHTMTIVIVEDTQFKRDQLIRFLKKENIQCESFEYVNYALRHIRKERENISGIILDLGLETMPGADDATLYRGLDVLKEMKRLKVNIPVLINSTTELEMVSCEYSNVFGYRTDMEDYDSLENFIYFLRQREEQ